MKIIIIKKINIQFLKIINNHMNNIFLFQINLCLNLQINMEFNYKTTLNSLLHHNQMLKVNNLKIINHN